MSDENEDLAKLMAIVNQEDEEDEEQLTEEELQQALNSPSLHRHIIDEESTECDDFEMNSGDINVNDTANVEESDHRSAEESTGQPTVKQKPGEYQFQMLDHHIFKGKHGKKLYKCDVCYAVYRHSFSLKRHFIRSHINYGYLCETDVTNCGINLSASASLQTWKEQQQSLGLTTPSPDMPDLYCCHSCVLFYDQLSQIKGHVDDCHRNNSSGTIEPIRIPCSECNMSFIQRHNLMRHIEVVHNGKRLYACKHCPKKFQTIADRKKHEKSQHQELCAPQDIPSRPVAATTTGQKSSAATHKCVKCSELFPTYAELRKHVTRKHKEFYNPCGFCNKFCFSKKQLSTHLRQKHEKTAKDNAKALRQKNKESTTVTEDQLSEKSAPTRGPVRNQQLSQQNQYQAYFHCSLCYRRFLTYGSLIRHKQVAHRPTRLSRLTADPQLDTEIVEPFSSGNEFEFYRNLAQKMAENLLYFVDGKSVNPSNDYKVIRNPHHKKVEPNPDINLQKYNFPEGFRCNPSPLPSSNQTEKLEFLFDCNLNTVKNPNFKPLIDETPAFDPLSTSVSTEGQPPKPLFICTACQQQISGELMDEHEANNHPNVKCSYIEVDPQMRNIPSQLLLWQYHCPEGLLQRCPTAPSLSRVEDDTKQSLNCTKCEQSFPSVSLLHNHILECAHNNSSKKKFSNNSNKSHNNAETQTVPIANTSTASITTIANTSLSDSQTEANTSHSSEATEKEFSSPLSPCKTRSGKRRQISPEDYVKTKRTRNSSKNSPNDSKTSQKSNTQSSETEVVVKSEDMDISVNKSDQKSNQKQKNEIMSSVESTPNTGVSKSLKTVPKNSNSVSKDDNQSSKFSADCLPKRYSCKKCSKKFVYMDSLSKHQLSCNKRVFTSKVNTKRDLRKSAKIPQKLAKNIELKALKNIKKSKEKRNSNKSETTSSADSYSKDIAKSDNCVANHLIDDDSKDKTEEEEFEKEEEAAETENDTSKEEEVNKSHSESESLLESDVPKQHNSAESPLPGLQIHRCPDCLRVFTYVANFRKHVTKVCPVRKQLSVDGSNQSSDMTPITSTLLTKSVLKDSIEVLVIKEETPEEDEKDGVSNEVKNEIKEETEDEVVFDGETRILRLVATEEECEDGNDNPSPKDESKLDLWRVKQENPQFAFKGSPAQHHCCPYCHRGFTYLANYRKHIKGIGCPIRLQIEEKKKRVIEENSDSENTIKPELPKMIYAPTSLSVRSQIEDTVLSLLRDQTKQDQILQSSEDLIKAKSESKAESTSPGDPESISPDINKSQSDSNENSESNPESKTQESDKTKDDLKKESTPTTTPSKGSTYKFRTFSCSICHKIFLSYVTMLKHRLSHKLSEGSLACNDDNNSNPTNATSLTQTPALNETDKHNNFDLSDSKEEKEAANQALASCLLKRSKEAVLNKMRLNAAAKTSGAANTKTSNSGPKTVINTTELLEKLARGGIATQSITTSLNTNPKSSTKSQEVITIETNNNNTNILNLQLNASTSSNSNNNLNTNSNNNNNNNNNSNNNNNINNGLEDIIIDANDLELNVLKDGVIMTEDLQQLIAVNDGKESVADDLPVNEVLLNLDDIENGNEVWITITDSSAYVQVPHNSTNNS